MCLASQADRKLRPFYRKLYTTASQRGQDSYANGRNCNATYTQLVRNLYTIDLRLLHDKLVVMVWKTGSLFSLCDKAGL